MISKKKTKSATTMAARIASIDTLASSIGQGTKRLTPKERNRKLKLRSGGVDMARTLATLATRYKLGALVDVPALLRNVTLLEQLQTLLASSTNLQEIVRDQVLGVSATSWSSATTIYTMLQRMAVDDPRIADELAPIAAQLALGKGRKGKAKKGAAPTATASTVPATASATAAAPTVTEKP
jgi:hypothetical protein